MWYYRLSDVRFQGPWRPSSYAVVVSADNLEKAIMKIDEVANDWPEEIQRLSRSSSYSLGHDTEQEARNAAQAEYKSIAS